jgi:hypothetical protein
MPSKLDAKIAIDAAVVGNKELKRDKTRLQRELDKERQRNASLMSEVRALDVDKTRLEGVVSNLEKDRQSLRAMKWSRQLGATLLAICGASAPLISFEIVPAIVVYYCLFACAVTSIFWGVWHSRTKPD